MAWTVAICAFGLFIILTGYLVAIAARPLLPAINAEIIESKLVKSRSQKARLVAFIVRYRTSSAQEGVLRFLFADGDADAVSSSKRFLELKRYFSAGATVRLHYVPG